MTKFLMALTILLAGCGATPQPTTITVTETVIRPEPVEFSNLFICDNLRAGATVEDVVEWEASEGIPPDQTYPRVEQAVNETCPEFEILLQDYKEAQ